MSFLTPLVFAALGAVAIPILVHLIQRERNRVVQFPSLMFLQRIPYQSVRRRRIRHWLLLAMRISAIALLVLAFARPFFQQGALAAAAAAGAREVVILLDQSASMGYGDHWQRAQEAAHRVVAGLSADDRATLVLFSRNAEENMRATSDRARLDAAIDAAKVTSDSTRFGPALKLAESILSQSSLKRREAVVISDFQKGGWGSVEDARFPEGFTLTTETVAADTSNVSVPSVTFARSEFSGQERVAVTAGIANRSDEPANVPVVLSVDGLELETKTATIGARASGSVTFAPFTVADANVRGTVRAGSDPLPADNTFHFVVSPSAPVSVAIIENGNRDASLYLSKALSIGSTPAFRADVVAVNRVTPATFEGRSVLIFNDTPLPSAAGGGALRRFIERGGGVLVVTGDRTSWLTDAEDLLPGQIGAPVDRIAGRSATIGFRDYSHPVFELFQAPRSGDFTSAHVFRYRVLTPGPEARVISRFDDGAVAAAERRTGAGRLIVWTSTLDDTWTDLVVKPVYLPLVHQLVRYLARYEQTPNWLTVGQVVDLASTAATIRGERVVVSPSGQRTTQAAGSPGLVELSEQGVYEIRAGGTTTGRPMAVAVNIDPAEADLTPLDPAELVASVTGRATQVEAATAVAEPMTPEDNERRQALWWYLLVAGMLLLAAETVISNRLSRKEKFL
ncbi:MAG TPA: BatA and WFA domain-containing protein [Vicinamibacterales bacterium]|nr:BatA and WFA domain-containing protein [Vicinamibacterales bacterium]